MCGIRNKICNGERIDIDIICIAFHTYPIASANATTITQLFRSRQGAQLVFCPRLTWEDPGLSPFAL